MNRSHVIHLREWLGLKRNIVVMLASTMILEMGEELWEKFIPKYLEFLGGSVLIISAYGALRDLLDAVYQYPGGWFADRFGRKQTLLVFTVLAIFGYLLYLFAAGWIAILVGTLFVMAWSSLTLPATFAMIADNLPETKRAIGFGVKSILKRIPTIVAPVIGGALIASFGLEKGIKSALCLTIVLALASFFVMRKFYQEDQKPVRDQLKLRGIWKTMNPQLKRLLLSDCLARWAEGIPKVFIVLYVINIMKIDALRFGWLASLQVIASIVFYIPFSKLSDKLNRKPFVLATFAFFALFPLMIGVATSFPWLVLAFIVGGLTEIGEPARKALIVDLSAESAVGRAIGLYYFIRGTVVFPASIIGGWLWIINPQFPFYSAFAIGVIGAVIYAFASDQGGKKHEMGYA